MMMQYLEKIESANMDIEAYFNQYYGNKMFFCVVLLCFVYLFISCEELRCKLLLPIALIFFVIINPIVYYFILSKVVYWRLFWMIPNVVLMGMTIVVLLQRQKRIWMKWIILAISIFFVIHYGENVFKWEPFTVVENWEKLSQETIDVSDAILELDKTPRAVIHSNIFIEVRQYAPEITLLYGRDAHGYIRWRELNAGIMYQLLSEENPDYYTFLEYVTAEKYNVLVFLKEKEVDVISFEKYGYREVCRTAEHIIYYNEEM